MMIRRVAEMTEPFLSRVVVPVANRDDAAVTATTPRSYVVMGATVIAVHVIEKAGGAPDKASVEQREQRAAEIVSVITGGFDDSGVALGTDLRYGTGSASSIVGAAHDRSARATVFTSRGGSRWRKLVTGDVTHNLVRSSDIPILVIPNYEYIEV
jgi:nucleotide-binding universal stress UspA family protein